MAESLLACEVIETRPGHSIACLRVRWKADADGSCDLNLSSTTNASTLVAGQLTHLVTKPGGTAPTDLYDVTITDGLGRDILNGLGLDQSGTVVKTTALMTTATVGSDKYGVNPSVCDSNLTLHITNNSINAAIGDLWLYFR